jgi:hypothetical protein
VSKTSEPVATGKPSSVRPTSDKLEAALLMINTFKDLNKTETVSEIITKYYTDEKLKKKVVA